jgi:hypothetical protein
MAHLRLAETEGNAQTLEIEYASGRKRVRVDTQVALAPAPANASAQEALTLLLGSVSLSQADKLRVLSAWPTLHDQARADLVELWRDERKEFARLPDAFDTVDALQDKALRAWVEWEATRPLP